MATGNIIGRVEYFWRKVDSNMQTCDNCECEIYSDVHQLVYRWWSIDRPEKEIIDMELCQSCYEDEDWDINFEPWDDDDIDYSLN